MLNTHREFHRVLADRLVPYAARAWMLVGLAALPAFAGCEGAQAECAVSADCAAIEVCRQGLCVLGDTAEPDGPPDAGRTPEPDDDDAGTQEPDGGPPLDAGPAVEPESDAGQDAGAQPEPFDAGPPCIDADNDQRGENCLLGPDCDDQDENVWVQMVGYADSDGDTVTVESPSVLCTNGTLPQGYLAEVSVPPDCNDDEETEFSLATLYFDSDGDNAFSAEPVEACIGATIPSNASETAPTPAQEDCDDADPRRAPGLTDVCDALDNNCDGRADSQNGQNACAGTNCVISFSQDDLLPYLFCPGPRTWANARDACASIDYQLVVFETAAESLDVMNLGVNLAGGDDWWIGLSDFAQEGTYVWVNGEALTFGHFQNGEPNNDGNEDCIEFRGNNGWNDVSCNNGNHFVCEAAPPPYVP